MEQEINVFGVKYKSDNPKLKINRNNYVTIDKKNHFQKQINTLLSHGWRLADKSIYEDDNHEFYSDEYCLKHKEDCLKNYDLNMNFFNKLDENEYNKTVSKLLNRYKKMYEIFDLNTVKNTSGIYVLALQDYKQLYVGESKNIYKRIKQHWNNIPKFDRLIFGKVEDSILSIDSFGPLDTKRIFIYETDYERKEIEEKIVKYIPECFLINRTRGGKRGFDDLCMKVDTIANRNKRELD